MKNLPLPKGLEEKNKDKLIKEDRIKKEKNTSEIYKKDGSYYERVLEGSNVIKDVCIDNELPFNIPDSWVWVRLGNVAEILRGGSPRPINKYLTTSNDGINWIKISDAEKNGKYINSTRERIIKEGINRSRFVKSGDFLLTNSMSFGRPYILNIDGCIHDGWLVITKYKIAYNREFLFYLLSSNFAYYQFCKNVSGSVVQNLSIDKVANSIFPLPPLDEQKRIAEVLSLCDDVIENLTKLIEQKELYKKGVMQRVLSGEVRFKGFKDEWKEIKISKLIEKNIIFIEKGKAISKNKIVEGDIPVIAGGKIPAYYHSEYTHDFPCITISASGAYSGYVWFHNYKIWASDCNVLYTENNRYNINFLFYYLSYIQELIYYMQTGGAQPHIYAKDIITLTVPNISIEEQKKIAGLLSVIDDDIDNLKKQLELRKQQKKGLMQRLLTGEVRI